MTQLFFNKIIELLFQAPGPEPSWTGEFDAVEEYIRCRQSVADVIAIGQQDCLTLNVYTPLNEPLDAKLPVMVFIHGGGYFQGSGSAMFYGPQYLVPKGVILVTFNYRLNIQGFLCLRIKEAPGNAAMKDQLAALKWVHRNIRAFGGDPDNVTLFGESAGAASVSFHVLSPLSKGLFHKVITQSGSALAPWTYQFRPVFLASLLAKKMNYETQDPQKLFEFFQTKSDDELILTRVPRQPGNVIASEILYTPCSEVPIEGETPFLTESPYDVLSKGTFNKVPMIIGSNTEEGLMLIGMDTNHMIDQVQFHQSIPKNLHIPSEGERKEFGQKLRDFYMGEDLNNTVKLSKLYGEPLLNYPSLEETELIVKSSDKPVYSYIFNYSGRRNLAKLNLRKPFNIPTNATHADELFYLFSQPLVPSFFEDEMIEKMTTLWTNFAKYGNPTPAVSDLLPVSWSPVEPASPQSLVIDKEFSTSPMWFTESLRYLRTVYSKYRRHR
nr:putative antennal esterase CXE17 [Ectropis grisescens]